MKRFKRERFRKKYFSKKNGLERNVSIKKWD